MAVLPASTGLYNFTPISASDAMLDAFERCGWRAASITNDMLISAQRSLNLVQTRWSNLGVNLWEVTPQSITLDQGVAQYTIDPTTIDVLPSPVIRLWQLSSSTNLAPSFTTILGSTVVTVNQPSNGLLVGNYVNIATPVAVGGTVVFGFYQVMSTPTANSYTINVTSPATSGTTGGTVPTFFTDGTTSSVLITLANQPFLAGQTFNVEVPTVVGGLTLNGSYLITAATTNNFTINATIASTSSQGITMNNGQAQIRSQPAQQLPTDRVLYPMSRADYTALSVKNQQGPPTSFWFDRTIVPTLTFWPVPDGQGPYQFIYYKNSQMQDASIQNGSIVNIPYRFVEAYVAAIAAHLAMKWRPDAAQILTQYAQQMWMEASDADREKVSVFISPCFDGYFS